LSFFILTVRLCGAEALELRNQFLPHTPLRKSVLVCAHSVLGTGSAPASSRLRAFASCSQAPELRNYFVAAGMNSIGILTGGGVGRLMANWIVNGEPDMDVTGMSPARFSE
jgi:glycine/D-amino acid oxidase-like deaminating enzyme